MMPRWITNFFAMPIATMIPSEDLPRIAAAIMANEALHNGQICFAIERSLGVGNVLDGMTARDRAHQVFANLRVWDTARNSGVLLYLLTAEHRIELIADRGFHEVVSDEQWRGVCQLLEERLQQGDATDAVVDAIDQISAIITEQFPRRPEDVVLNELSDLPVIL